MIDGDMGKSSRIMRRYSLKRLLPLVLPTSPTARKGPVMPDMPQPRTGFDWTVYSDATFAGLSVLIPIPFIDWIFEEYFRRRIPSTIAGYRGYKLHPTVRKRINKGTGTLLGTILALPVTVLFKAIKRISRKILYFLTIKEASDKLSRYWHRAFLIDYMLLAGHLEDEGSALVAHRALEHILDGTTTSPLSALAQRVVDTPGRVLRAIRRAVWGGEDESIREKKSEIKRYWPSVEEYLKILAEKYHTVYREMQTRHTPP